MIGIVYGLGAASLQSVAYLLSRAVLNRPGFSPGLLLVVSHAIMGLLSLLMLPWMLMQPVSWNQGVFLGAASAGGFYLIGQLALFRALRHIDASRLAPLLGTKILFLAVLAIVTGADGLSPRQWIAVALAVGAVFMLNEAGGRLPLKGLLAVGVAIVGYSLSDLSIVRLVQATGLANWRGSLLGALLTYLMCGLVLAPLLTRHPMAARQAAWRMAWPYAACWFAAMVLLFACFAEIGAVFGNIVQSTRGLISILLGLLMVRFGWTDLERRVGWNAQIKKILGALAMIAAIALYLKG